MNSASNRTLSGRSCEAKGAPPHMGDSIECNWTEAMVYRIRDKAEKFAHPGFAKHQRNWLLIYDDWSPAPALDDRELMKRIEGKFFSHDWINPLTENSFSGYQMYGSSAAGPIR